MSELKENIKAFLEKEAKQEITDENQDLVKAGVVDSFSMLKLIAYIEDELHIKLEVDDMDLQVFGSLSGIMKSIEKSQSS